MTIHTATYSAEDNKIRLYASARLDAETYQRVKTEGFLWAPKQELFVAPKWTPAREDLAIELAGQIEPEEMTMAERAAIKAERLDNLALKNHAKANAYQRAAENISEQFADGQPILIGHHSERKARRNHDKMTRAQDTAIKASKAANYWLYRAEGVEAHANYKNNPRVRANRIETLLADLRDIQRQLTHADLALQFWDNLGDDEALIRRAIGEAIATGRLSTSQIYNDLSADLIPPLDAKLRSIEMWRASLAGQYKKRWIDHILNRLSFERELLGPVAMYEGELTPVILQAFARTHGAHKPEAKNIDGDLFTLESPSMLPLHLAANRSMELSADEWRDLMQSVGYEVPTKIERRKSEKPKDAPLINPTLEQAERLQKMWNKRVHLTYAIKTYRPKDNQVLSVTQATYSDNSGGSYSRLETKEIDDNGAIISSHWHGGKFVKTGEAVARIRVRHMLDMGGARGVVHINDKAAKDLPIDLDAIEAAQILVQEVAA